VTTSPAPPTEDAGILGVDHVAVTVPDMGEALALFVDVLGGEVVHQIGPLPPRPPSQSTTPDRFGRHPDACVVTLTMVRVGTSVFELFEFASPDQRTDLPRWSDLGSYHVAMRVRDVAATASRLEAAGVELLGEVGGGIEPGMQALFTRTSWGLIIELISYAEGSDLAAAMRGEPPVPTRRL
jgi:catechol 2,3-dioxygenase-like lactoylglutathione lyase family enzyme